MEYRKKPVVINAIQWNGTNKEEIVDFLEDDGNYHFEYDDDLVVHTLEGNHHANLGDFIIQGIKGEFYPCKPDIFEMTYEKA